MGATNSSAQNVPEGTAAEEEQGSIVKREVFSSATGAWMEIEISEDRQQAELKELCCCGDASIAAANITKALVDLFAIKHGVLESAVEELASRAQAAPDKVHRDIIVARGTPPVPGAAGQIEFTFAEDDAAGLSFAGLKTALAQKTLDEALAVELQTCLVEPGRELAICTPPGEGEEGHDILGQAIPAPVQTARVTAGSNVREEGDHIIADAYGYVWVGEDQLSVLPPVWVSADDMEAHFIYFPQVEKVELRADWLADALQRRGITHGAEEARVEALCQSPPAAAELFSCLLARGTPPEHGVDTHVEYSFDPEKKGGAIREDGSIDLRERNAAITVEENQLLGEVVQVTKGIPGTNLLGEEIAAKDGEQRTFKGGDNVRVELEGGQPKAFYAQTKGNAHVKGETIEVQPVFKVSGDVDYETGNIEVGTDLDIKGSVLSGFTVKAAGSISVGGTIELGASVHAQGDIAAAQGIVGESTVVEAGGDIETKFIQHGTVTAQGDLVVGSYIHNAKVRVGGRIEVQAGGGEHGGSIIGGEVFATGGIAARYYGSDSSEHTLVGIGLEPQQAAELAKTVKLVGFCEKNIAQICRALGLKNENDERVETLVDAAPEAKRAVLAKLVGELEKLKKVWKKAFGEQRNLESQIAAHLKAARVDAAEKIFPGVEICFGTASTTVTEALAASSFSMVTDSIQRSDYAGE